MKFWEAHTMMGGDKNCLDFWFDILYAPLLFIIHISRTQKIRRFSKCLQFQKPTPHTHQFDNLLLGVYS